MSRVRLVFAGVATPPIDKRQSYNDLKIALEVFTMLHSSAVEKYAPELAVHRPAVARDIKATLERIEAAKSSGI